MSVNERAFLSHKIFVDHSVLKTVNTGLERTVKILKEKI